VGGSLGASALNALIPKALALLPADKRPRVVHQSGRQHLDILRENYAAAGVEAEVRDYIEDMAAAYRDCDFAICRAGAMTVAELACAGVPAVLVPFPFAVDDHQTGNAEFLSQAGAAWLMQQKDLTADKLAALIGGLDRATLAAMSDKARKLARPDATRQVADICEALAR
jgi:UDP-N-acetylglucosamine--N-acetylmuramyl-(pentapeptide) pyrophosphoryl-undecaprenol N-acetylglucosamine transferase